MPKHPFEVLLWATKHDHVLIADEAAELSLDGFRPDQTMCDLVPTAWVRPPLCLLTLESEGLNVMTQ